MRRPLDEELYDRDPRSSPIDIGIADGSYVYVRDEHGTIFVLPDGQHLHPKVLGGSQLAMYAGDLTVKFGKIKDLTNLSGTFQFSDAEGLLDVAIVLEEIGFQIMPGAVRLISYIDIARAKVLR